MKKTAKKMILNRETLRLLNAETLADAAGGTYPDPPSRVSCGNTICPDQPATQVTGTNCA
jgi:hypothetical protein